MYYGIRVNTSSPSTATYLYVTLTSSGDFDGAAAMLHPTAANTVWFSYQDKSVQMQLPALSNLSAGITVVTGGINVAGTLGVSPAINTDVVLTLSGVKPIGAVTLKAGETSVDFDFKVTPVESLPDGGSGFLQQAAPQPQ
jgi:hypothetical protein